MGLLALVFLHFNFIVSLMNRVNGKRQHAEPHRRSLTPTYTRNDHDYLTISRCMGAKSYTNAKARTHTYAMRLQLKSSWKCSDRVVATWLPRLSRSFCDCFVSYSNGVCAFFLFFIHGSIYRRGVCAHKQREPQSIVVCEPWNKEIFAADVVDDCTRFMQTNSVKATTHAVACVRVCVCVWVLCLLHSSDAAMFRCRFTSCCCFFHSFLNAKRW